MEYYILGSGSKGNCTIFKNDNGELLMIDCGLSITEIKNRMAKYNLKIEDVKALLITHLHTDHCASLRAFDNDIIYLNEANKMNDVHTFGYYEQLMLLGYEIYTLPVSHDAPGTTGFIINYKDEKLAYITDTGYIHENIQQLINNSEYFLIESNHDPRMLMMTRRPMFIKNRILSTNGHMSNQDCAYVLGNVIGPNTKEIVFIHKSEEANSEEMILETFNNTMKERNINTHRISIQVAYQDTPITNKV